MRFRALGGGYMYLLRVLIGSLDCLAVPVVIGLSVMKLAFTPIETALNYKGEFGNFMDM